MEATILGHAGKWYASENNNNNNNNNKISVTDFISIKFCTTLAGNESIQHRKRTAFPLNINSSEGFLLAASNKIVNIVKHYIKIPCQFPNF